MDSLSLKQLGDSYLHKVCNEIGERSVGSSGNREATRFLRDIFQSLDWEVETPEFDAINWTHTGASLQSNGKSFNVTPSPYSLGCQVAADLISVSSLMDLERTEIQDKIVLLHGDIAAEQIMPKNFSFYNPKEHQQIVALLERGSPQAIVTATGRNPALAGGVYPFPMFEDGDFDIPSVYMTAEEGKEFALFSGEKVFLESRTERIPGKGYNVIGSQGDPEGDRIVITAHIDAKKGTPGATDNATGVTVLLLLAHLLQDYDGPRNIELVAFNGEDYYSAPGQILYVRENQDQWDSILLNINIDGAGYREGPSAFSFFQMPDLTKQLILDVMEQHDEIQEGRPWVQGDHSIFVQFGRPALAVTSQWFLDNMESQKITHTPDDNLGIVNARRLTEIAHALSEIIRTL